jgi:hypothetical protein
VSCLAPTEASLALSTGWQHPLQIIVIITTKFPDQAAPDADVVQQWTHNRTTVHKHAPPASSFQHGCDCIGASLSWLGLLSTRSVHMTRI